MQGICTLCGKDRQLTFEHVPPRASGNNTPVKLYKGIDTIGNDRAPWEFEGLKYKNAQKGSGGYYLCVDCNNRTGTWYAYALSDMFIQARNQNITPVYIHEFRFLSWDIELRNIRPFNIAKQILVMISCASGRCIVLSNPEIDQLINNKKFKPRQFPHSIQIFLNAGPMMVSYGITASANWSGESRVVAGLSTELFGFNLAINTDKNPANYLDITDWLLKYDCDEEVSVSITVPVYETNIMFPENHRSKAELNAIKDENNHLYPK